MSYSIGFSLIVILGRVFRDIKELLVALFIGVYLLRVVQTGKMF